jgi:beta-glucosidase-like glycosyl hydrolase
MSKNYKQSIANRLIIRVLTDLLRDELQFGGLAVTDYGDIERLHTAHHVAATEREVNSQK